MTVGAHMQGHGVGGVPEPVGGTAAEDRPTPAIDALGVAYDAVLDADRYVSNWYLLPDATGRNDAARIGLGRIDAALAALVATRDVLSGELRRVAVPEQRSENRGGG